MRDSRHAPLCTTAQTLHPPLPGSPFNLLCRVSWAHSYPRLIRNKGWQLVVILDSAKVMPGLPWHTDRTWPSHRKHCNPFTKECPLLSLGRTSSQRLKSSEEASRGRGRKCRVRRLIFELGNDFQAAPGDFSPLLQAGPSAHEGKRGKWPRTGDHRILNPSLRSPFPSPDSPTPGPSRVLCQGVGGQ